MTARPRLIDLFFFNFYHPSALSGSRNRDRHFSVIPADPLISFLLKSLFPEPAHELHIELADIESLNILPVQVDHIAVGDPPLRIRVPEHFKRSPPLEGFLSHKAVVIPERISLHSSGAGFSRLMISLCA